MNLKPKWAILLLALAILAAGWGWHWYAERYGNGQFEKIAPVGG